MEIRLVKPTAGMERAAEEFKEEFFAAGERVINGSALLDKLEYGEWLVHAEKSSRGAAGEGWVRADTFFAVDERNRIVGIIDFRHNLNNAFLAEFGGHVGYAVRPSERKKGYCTQMLNAIKAYASENGIGQLMLSCYKDNTASLKTMLRCGGRVAGEKNYLDGKPMCVVYIDTSR